MFETFEKLDAEPDANLLTSIPTELTLGGRTSKRHEIEPVVDGRLDMGPLWAGRFNGNVAYIYIPLTIDSSGTYTFWFDTGWGFKAWIDGEPVADTQDAGHSLPPFDERDKLTIDLADGERLLVLKLLSGPHQHWLRIIGPVISGEELGASQLDDPFVAEFQALPFKENGIAVRLDLVGGFYHRDDWSRRHPIFDELPSGGLMDWTIYRNIVPHGGVSLKGIDAPDEAVCGAIRTSLGYDSGLYVAVYRRFGGKIILNCLKIRENIGKDPVAERLLRNMLNYAALPLEGPGHQSGTG